MKVRIKFSDGISELIYTNKGVRQGCGLSPVLFNIYINKIIQEFKLVIKKGIQLNNRKLVNTILYADDRILMATSEDELQNDHIQHKNKINGSVWEIHAEGKNCDKQQDY